MAKSSPWMERAAPSLSNSRAKTAPTLSQMNAVIHLDDVELRHMFSLKTRIVALPAKRDALADVLLKSSRHVPGCLSYGVAKDPRDESSVWINEVWQSESLHRSALLLPQMKEATIAALPMIAGVGEGSVIPENFVAIEIVELSHAPA